MIYKKLIPSSLLGRSLIIIFVPLVTIVTLTVFIFYQTSWTIISKRLAQSVVGDINVVVKLIDQGLKFKAIRIAKEYFKTVRATMGAEELEECWNIWEIAPKEDPQNLREAYVKKEVFNIGTKVEDVTTGLTGRIIRRGANHLICVTEDEMMFKSWIKDVSESVVNGCLLYTSDAADE